MAAPDNHQPPAPARLGALVPAPVWSQARQHDDFKLTPGTKVVATTRDASGVAAYLATVLGLHPGVADHGRGNAITLRLGHDPRIGTEGYTLDIRHGGVELAANTSDGLFEGVQSLRQLVHAGTLPGGSVLDYPRFEHRGAMLDVARHFFGVDDVKRYIDEIAMFKINYLHLHLADDQGWRIEIKSWPNLTAYGASTEVGGGPGGYYTQDQYKDLVAYAESRHITIVPEIDMPGHTNAALASYAELNCDGVAPPLYTGTSVGFSSLCVAKDITYRFLDDVIRELASITPGPYLHIGGDEAHATTPADYQTFMHRMLPIVAKYGKIATGWHELAKTNPDPSALPQYWGTDSTDTDVAAAAARGNKVIMSPANKTYLDMKYNPNTPIGQKWAGLIEEKDAYGWDPGTFLDGVPESSVQGVEAPLWTETIVTMADIEYMAFPRLPAIAELGWSPWSTHDYDDFARRVAAQAPTWDAMGINYYRSPQIPW
nr:beta-N-acetylhexosaminidase [Labedaea rhizosphaerae]